MIVFLSYAAGVLAVFWQVAIGGRSFINRDIHSYYFPMWHTVADFWKEGLPLWNPLISFGAPLLANPQACVLYPPTVLFHLLDFTLGFNLYILLHIAMAAAFTYLWMRDGGASGPASWVAGAAFAFSGYLVSVICLTNSLCAAAYFPLALWAFRRALGRGSPGAKALVSLALLAQYLAGEPGISFITIGTLGAFSLYRRRGAVRAFLQCACLFAALAAVQWIPFAELLAYSERLRMTAGEKTMWSLGLADVASLYVRLLSELDTLYTGYWLRQSWLSDAYAGAGVITLAALGCVRGRREPRVQYLMLLAGLGLLLAAGCHSPLYVLMQAIPPLGLVRYPVRYFLLTAFALACLAGHGWDAVFRIRKTPSPARTALVAAMAVSVAAVLLIELNNAGFARLVGRLLTVCFPDLLKPGIPRAEVTGTVLNVINSLRHTFYFTALTLTAAAAGCCAGARKFWLSAFLGFAVLTDLLLVHSHETTIRAGSFMEPSANLSVMMKDTGLFRSMASPKAIEESEFMTAPSPEERLRAAKEKLSPNLPMLFGLEDAIGYDSVRLRRTLEARWLFPHITPSRTRLLDALNVKYIASPNESLGEGFRLVNRTPYVNLFINKRVLPRAFLAARAERLAPETILRRLMDTAFDPLEVVYLEEDPPARGIPAAAARKDDPGVEITDYSPAHVAMDVRVGEDPWLFFSDAYFPGWRLYAADGKPQKIYRANYAFRAVRLEPGAHRLVWRYEPWTVKLGAVISLLALIAAARRRWLS